MGKRQDREKLVNALAKLRGWRQQVGKARDVAHDFVRAGRGGVLTQRYLKTRLVEGERLAAMLPDDLADDDAAR